MQINILRSQMLNLAQKHNGAVRCVGQQLALLITWGEAFPTVTSQSWVYELDAWTPFSSADLAVTQGSKTLQLWVLCRHQMLTSLRCRSSFTVRSIQLRGEVFQGQILSVADVVWWEAYGRLDCCDHQWAGDSLPPQAQWTGADIHRKPLPPPLPRCLGGCRLHWWGEHRGGHFRWQQCLPCPVLQSLRERGE